jgi:hypothetical protein
METATQLRDRHLTAGWMPAGDCPTCAQEIIACRELTQDVVTTYCPTCDDYEMLKVERATWLALKHPANGPANIVGHL